MRSAFSSTTAWRAIFPFLLFLFLAVPCRGATVVVEMINYTFSPSSQTVNAGDTILWTNLDQAFHTSTSGASGNPDGLWNSGTMTLGNTFSFTFNVPQGSYPYFCTFHYTIGMVGSVTVQAVNVPPSVSIVSPANGAIFAAGSSITIEATASASNGMVARVDFFENGNLIGSATSAPYSATFANAPAGQYALSAVAVDSHGVSSAPAVVNVTVQTANVPPSVSITSPATGANFPVGSSITIEATASASNGTVARVDFFENGNLIGSATSAPYSATFANAPAGQYALSAVAVDSHGVSSAPAVVNVTVQAANVPAVTITSPVNGQVFPAGTNILVQASASEIDGSITQVQFFVNSTLVGTVTSPPYDFTLSNVFSGTYVLTASATDNKGVTSSSSSVTITVGTNAPPTVVITQPTNGARFPANGTVTVSANASSPGGQITQVAFFIGTNSAGVVTSPPYAVTLSNLLPGNYSLLAKATDSRGTVVTSSAVSISVFGPPGISLIRPAANSRFAAGSSVVLTATVTTTGATVTNVEFLADSTLVGERATAPYMFTWVPSAAGTVSLTGVAFDEFGQMGTSAPVPVRVFVPETTSPSIRITKAPNNTARLSVGQISIFGTAEDKVAIDHVDFQVNGGPFHPAIGTNSWQADIALSPGKNAIGLRSVNQAGNTSVEVFRFYTYVVDVPLSVQIAGPGSVTPDLNGQLLEIGKVYRLTAKPNAGALFTGWTGGLTSAPPSLSFQMISNLILIANFVTNPFISVSGQYTGLILNSNAVFPANSAFLTVQVGGLGAFSGKLSIAGATYAFHDQFSLSGGVTVPVMRPNLVPVALTLQLDLTNGSNEITGTATDGTWTSDVLADRNIFNAQSNPAPQAGSVIFSLDRTPDEGGAAAAQAIAIISRSGSVFVGGALTDGRKFSLESALSSNGDLPFYVSLSHGTEVLIGWLNVSGSPASSVTGSVFWTRADTNGFSTILTAGP